MVTVLKKMDKLDKMKLNKVEQEKGVAKELSKETIMADEKVKKIEDLKIGDFVTDGDEWAEVTQSSESGTDKYYAYRGQLNDGSLEQFEVKLNQLIAVSDFHDEEE